MPLQMTKDGLKVLQDAMDTLATRQVLAGVPEAETTRTDAENKDGITNAALAYIHENGAPEAGIPARPFMRPGIENVKDKLAKMMVGAAKAVVDGGDDQEVMKRLTAAALVAESAIRDKIVDGPFKPLAEATIANRRRQGRMGTAPLIDTGALKASIKGVVRKVPVT
jgi:hypothetical protein